VEVHTPVLGSYRRQLDVELIGQFRERVERHTRESGLGSR
jgi:hypothetical protein